MSSKEVVVVVNIEGKDYLKNKKVNDEVLHQGLRYKVIEINNANDTIKLEPREQPSSERMGGKRRKSRRSRKSRKSKRKSQRRRKTHRRRR